MTDGSGETASSVQGVLEDLEQAEWEYLHEIETMPEDERAAVELRHIMGSNQQPMSVEFVRVTTKRPEDEPTQPRLLCCLSTCWTDSTMKRRDQQCSAPSAASSCAVRRELWVWQELDIAAV